MIYNIKGEHIGNPYPPTFSCFFMEADIYAKWVYQLQFWYMKLFLRWVILNIIFLQDRYLLLCIYIGSCLGEESEFSHLNGKNNRLENLYVKKLHKALLNLVNIILKNIGLITVSIFDRFILLSWIVWT